MKRRSNYTSNFWFLHKDNQPEVSGINVVSEFDLNILAEGFSLLQPSDLDKFLNDGNMCQSFPSILAMRNLRFRMIESDRGEYIRIALLLLSVHIDVGSEDLGLVPFHAQGADAHRDLRRFRSLQEDLAHLLRVIQLQFILSIYDYLRCVWTAESKGMDIVALPGCQQR